MTGSGVVLASISALLIMAGVLLGYPELVTLGLAFLTALLVALASLLLRSNLDAGRVLQPVRVTEGGFIRSQLTFTNTARFRSLPALAVESVGRIESAVPVPSLGPGEQFHSTVQVPTPDRGMYEVPPPAIGHSDPFLLVRRSSRAGHESVLWVHPRTRDVAELPGTGMSDMDGRTSPFSLQGGAAFHSLRDYRDGDDWRLIHWPSTARTGRVVVRHNVVPDETHHVVLLDTQAGSYAEPGAFEDAVRFAASWCMATTRAGFPLTLVTTAGRRARHDPLGGSGLPPVPALDLLAEARLGKDAGLRGAIGLVPKEHGLAIGVITGSPAVADLAVLPQLVRGATSVNLACLGMSVPPALPAGGIRAIAGSDLDEAAGRWNRLVRR